MLREFLILAWVLISVFSIGLAICHRYFRQRGIDLLGYGAAAGVFIHSLVGMWIAILWHARHWFVFLWIAAVLSALVYLLWRNVFAEMFAALTRAMRIALFLWLMFLCACLALTHVEVTWPASLSDGLYIFKTHRDHVKIQYLCSLPADNYLPYVVTEYFVRHLSFKREHPILPGQEVSDRTVLMSLVTVPFRTVFDWNHHARKKLGRFAYVESNWPDTARLDDDHSFNDFLPIGIFLNSLLLLGLLVLFSNLYVGQSFVPATILFATSPYFIVQTIFTWPKALAGFFILLAWDSIRRGRSAVVVAFCAALAYHSHPSSIAAVIAIFGWYGWRALRDRTNWRPLIEFGAVALLIVLPWFIWTKLDLKIPSDLIAQNAGGAPEASAHFVVNFFWVRAVNAFTTLTPLIFLPFPFQADVVANYSTICLPTAVGLLIIPFAIVECFRLARTEAGLIWFGLFIPSALLLLIFGQPAVPLLHGWQQFAGALIFLATMSTRRILPRWAFVTVIVAQLAFNFALIGTRVAMVGAHF